MDSKEKNKIKWDIKHKSFVCAGKYLRGIHPVLSQYFYPKFIHDRLKLNGKQEHLSQQEWKSGYVKRCMAKGYKGMTLGRLVDQQITTGARFMKQYKLPQKYLTNLTPLPTHHNVMEDKLLRVLQTFRKGEHEYVNLFFSALTRLKWTVIGTQIPVGCVVLGLATAVDVVCTNEWGDTILLEVKTGFDSYYHCYIGQMEAPLEMYTDSPYHQHLLQLLVTKLLYMRTYPEKRISYCYIVRLNLHGIDLISLDSLKLTDLQLRSIIAAIEVR